MDRPTRAGGHPRVSALALFWLVFRASLLSTGGLGNVPALHADLVRGGIVDERTFANAIAVGQVSPGPNGLWVVVLGYDVAGLFGAMLALLAASLPPLVVLLTSAFFRRSRQPAVTGLVWGLGLTVAGVTGAVLLRILVHDGPSLATLAIGAGAFALALHGRAPVLMILVAGALAGLLLGVPN